MANPLSGIAGTTHDGSQSYRCDTCVSKFRFAIVEFDNISRDDQLEFLMVIPLPIAALIDSVGKSIHGWIKIDGIPSLKEWNDVIKGKLYKQRIV
jgi:hypothetical protein